MSSWRTHERLWYLGRCINGLGNRYTLEWSVGCLVHHQRLESSQLEHRLAQRSCGWDCNPIMRDKDIWDADVLIHSDNKGVIGTFCKGCSSNFMVNLSIHCSKEIYPSMGLYVNICWHSSESRWSHLPRHPPSFTPSPPLSNTTSSPHLTILHSCLTPPHSQMHSRMSMLMQKWRPSMFKPEMTYKGLSLCLWMDKSEYHENLKKTLASSPHIFAPMFLQVIM